MKTRDRRAKQDFRGKQDKKGVKQEVSRSGKRQGNTIGAAESAAAARERTKRSGVEAVKLHLQVTGDPGRTSRSATSVRKTSIRMTAIKEYPFDLSDLQNQPSVVGGDTRPAQTQPNPSAIKQRVSVPSLEGKRKVSIMADESSKDRENLPSDRLGRW